jgi:hypothetical protein
MHPSSPHTHTRTQAAVAAIGEAEHALGCGGEVPSLDTASHAAYEAQQAMMGAGDDNACPRAVVQLVR